MWLCTQHGFYSIVQKGEDEFHIRARLRRDLENLQKLGGWKWKIHRSLNADYRFRAVVTRREIAPVFMKLCEAINYSNFKGRIHELPDQRGKGDAYSGFWHSMWSVQARAEESESGSGRQ